MNFFPEDFQELFQTPEKDIKRTKEISMQRDKGSGSSLCRLSLFLTVLSKKTVYLVYADFNSEMFASIMNDFDFAMNIDKQNCYLYSSRIGRRGAPLTKEKV